MFSTSGCGLSPPSEITTPLKSGYTISRVAVTFSPDAAVFSEDPGTPVDASADEVRKAAAISIQKGVNTRMSEIMLGSKPAEAHVTVLSLNCPKVQAIKLIGGFSQLKAEIFIRDAETGAEIYPKRTLWAIDDPSFGMKNLEAAKRLEPDGDRNCSLLLALQIASSVFGQVTTMPKYLQVYVP